MIQIIVILFGSIAAIVFALIYKAKSDTKKQLQRLENKVAEIASENKTSWSNQYVNKHRAFAWSTDKKMLFFMDFHNDQERTHLIDMTQVSHCNLIERSVGGFRNKVESGDVNITSVDIEICFPNKECIALPMYTEIDDGLFERIRLTNKANHWIALIQPKNQTL